MKLKKGLIIKEVGGRAIVISTDPSVSFDGMLALNESARFLWNMLESGAQREELMLALMSEYDIDRALAERDTDALLSTLRELSLIYEDERTVK